MILSPQELRNLVELKHRSPHDLLGMHPLGDGSGVVVRALVPDAVAVEIQPVHETDKPAIKLERLHEAGLFEGVSKEASQVYAYELVITDGQGNVRRARDPYSFLPTLGEADLYLFGKGDERRLYEKLGAQLRTHRWRAGRQLRGLGAERPARQCRRQISTAGTRAVIRCGCSGCRACGRLFIPGVAEGAMYKFEIRDARGRVVLKTDPYGVLL